MSPAAPPGRGEWDDSPSGLLTLRPDGVVLAANHTLLSWVGRERADVVGTVRFGELLSVGGRIYWETHLSPLLHVEGRVDEVAVELRTAEGRRPVLISAVVVAGPDGPGIVQVGISSARERSRYERELLTARTAADRSSASLRVLQQTTAALSRAVGVDAVAAALLDSVVQQLGAASGTLWLQHPDRGLVVHGSLGETAPPTPSSGSVLAGRSAVLEGERAVVPLHGQSEPQGVLSAAGRADAGADPLDLEVLSAVGQQAGLALDRAQLYEQSSSVARELQHSLLAVDPPEDSRFAIATTYRPGVEMLEVGGDWYDVFYADDGLLSVVVGDVVGRGLGAASAMGQLRSAVRAVAGPEVGPAKLFTRLDRFVDQVDAARMATVAYAELDLTTGLVRYACAGHPPPLLLPVDGPPRLVWEGRSTPLGAFVQATPRNEAQLQLAVGDRLLLFTDGLFERRDRALDEGLELLRETAGALGDLSLDDAVQHLTATLLRDEVTRDDVCVLLLRWSGSDFAREVAGDLRGLSGMRRELAAWLRGHGLISSAVRDLVLATSEATANAAEHGSGGRASESVTVRAWLEQGSSDPDPGTVFVSVRDRGVWRPATSFDERGRGLVLMRALADDVSVESADGTTVVLRRRLRQEVP